MSASRNIGLVTNLLIALCDAALASLAMFAAQGLSDHAIYTKVVFVELSQFHKLVNDGLGGTATR